MQTLRTEMKEGDLAGGGELGAKRLSVVYEVDGLSKSVLRWVNYLVVR